MRWRWFIVLLLAGACHRSVENKAAPSPGGSALTGPGGGLDACGLDPAWGGALKSPLQLGRGDPLNPRGAARDFYDDGRYAEALACAARASALSPADPQAHSERGAALAALGHLEDAQLAYSRALALN